LTLSKEDRRALRVVIVVFAGFLTGLGLLFYIVATDL
jgi:phage shock protein PspC (stress-responsive transcriptional regulator)